MHAESLTNSFFPDGHQESLNESHKRSEDDQKFKANKRNNNIDEP